MDATSHPSGSRPVKRTPRWWRRAVVASRKANLFLLLEIAALAGLIVMAWASYVAVSRAPEAELLPSAQAATLLVGTLIPALALLVLLGRRAAIRRQKGSGGRLHTRLVFFFSMVAAVPTLLVVVFASFLFQSGVEFWFSDRSRGLVENANQLARGYYDQNQRDISNQTVTMADDLRSYLAQYSIASPEFQEGYSFQVLNRGLSESAIIQLGEDGMSRIVAIVDPDEDERQRISGPTFERLLGGETVVTDTTDTGIEAVTAIDLELGLFLYAGRTSDILALSQYNNAQNVVEAYDELAGQARTLQLRFNIALFFVSLALVGIAIWFALRFANRQVTPLTDLVSAARSVGAGNYALRVEGRRGADEIGLLNRAFNRMTEQIERQTAQLVGANTQLDERRAFIEAVLESVSAGVLSVDNAGTVQLMNGSAQKLLLDKQGPTPVGASLADLAPQIEALREANLHNGLVQYSKDGELKTLAVTLASDREGHVITFEDITRQLLDQRQAAWSDVARRIAHEIKNPLTPIQLATERLRRRYGKQIETDVELFDELTGTIVRQVATLRKMVDEFSSFARLPKPVFRSEDAVDLVRQALFLQEVAHPEVDFGLATASDALLLACDRHQVGQALTNVLKNAVEAVEARSRTAEPDYRGRIAVELSSTEDHVSVSVSDNGPGLPKEGAAVVEPYVTTREKGTGLGLAIVKKIVEEHGGEMQLAEVADGGTRVTLSFARDPASQLRTAEAAE
ncbi:ATP-binding protein [Alteriqipengyuania flavescens]|uniref:sensor histidine kinase n=1 Tax=Alteriqipengyuania flavescens TaxID=3053610 RepID=UPI0025B5603B|nr:ATP-binding protein [Alteriqipengyuania flavescens]WJY18202.1 ATP-binding protein [Alteriqipengyuania flavescens]WJY24143.1 ATP-binding protein [Alteriqipengyuania flavescens]